jgi:orotidine-5'-phosphate decarboxylase
MPTGEAVDQRASRTIDRATPAGSSAPVIGRPTTM